MTLFMPGASPPLVKTAMRFNVRSPVGRAPDGPDLGFDLPD
jgi:hypothetical protein